MQDGVSQSKLVGMSRDMAEEFYFPHTQLQLGVSVLRLSLPPGLLPIPPKNVMTARVTLKQEFHFSTKFRNGNM